MASQPHGAARTQLSVALCFGTFPPEHNGGADFVFRLAHALAENGVRVTVLTSHTAGAPTEEQLAPGLVVQRIIDDWALTRRGLASLSRARKLLEREAVDVVHVLFPDSVVQDRYQLPALLATRRRPIVTTFWNLGIGRRSPWPLRLSSLALLARSTVVTSHDPGYLRHLKRLVGWRKPVVWLPVGSNVAGPLQTLPVEPARGEGSEIAYFGQLDRTRGIDTLFHALAELRRERDTRLVMIGSGDRVERYALDAEALKEYRRLRALPRELGIEDVVEWTAYLPAEGVEQRLKAADVCVFPYRRNSLGRSALAAALSVGAPTIVGGRAEDIEPLRSGVHMLAVTPGDSRALADAIRRVLDEPELREKLASGASVAARYFAWDRIAVSATEIYRLALR